MEDVEKRAKKCPLTLAINLINKKWVIQLIKDLFFGKTHFNEFKEDKPNLSNKVLSNCLKDMEDNGLIKKTVNIDDSLSIEYHLTDKGKALNKVIYELAMFTLTTDVDNKYFSEDMKKELMQLYKEKMHIDQ